MSSWFLARLHVTVSRDCSTWLKFDSVCWCSRCYACARFVLPTRSAIPYASSLHILYLWLSVSRIFSVDWIFLGATVFVIEEWKVKEFDLSEVDPRVHAFKNLFPFFFYSVKASHCYAYTIYANGRINEMI